MSRVVRIGRHRYDVYIGRACRGLPCSPYANPFIVGKHGTREDVLRMYKEWIYRQPRLIEKAQRELPGKVLGCWCAPKPCHGDILIEIVSRVDAWETLPNDDIDLILRGKDHSPEKPGVQS